MYIYSQETLILQEGLVGNNFSPEGGHRVCKQCLHPVAASGSESEWSLCNNGSGGAYSRLLMQQGWTSSNTVEQRGEEFHSFFSIHLGTYLWLNQVVD